MDNKKLKQANLDIVVLGKAVEDIDYLSKKYKMNKEIDNIISQIHRLISEKIVLDGVKHIIAKKISEE